MVVGKQRVLREAAPVKLQSRSRAGRRAALRGRPRDAAVGARRHAPARSRLQDYGSCGRSPRDAGALYVTQVGPDRRRGPAGWVYKVGRRAGTTGAADPAGPFGHGRRLRGGAACCGSGASRTAARRASARLEVSPSASTVAPGRAVCGDGARL